MIEGIRVQTEKWNPTNWISACIMLYKNTAPKSGINVNIDSTYISSSGTQSWYELQLFVYHYMVPVHYCDIMGAIAPQITSLMFVYSTVYSDADQRKHQSSASLAFVCGIHRDRWILRTNGQKRGKRFHLMTSSWYISLHSFNTHCCCHLQRDESRWRGQTKRVHKISAEISGNPLIYKFRPSGAGIPI